MNDRRFADRRTADGQCAGLLRTFNETAPIACYSGRGLSYRNQGQAIVDLPYNPGLDHSLGGIHGGV